MNKPKSRSNSETVSQNIYIYLRSGLIRRIYLRENKEQYRIKAKDRTTKTTISR
jgi:hypothetical protein